MPAVSKQQQKFFGIVRAIQKGDAPASKFSKSAQKAAKTMKKKDVKDFADTDRKGLPKKVQKEERDYKAEYKKFQSSDKAKKYRAELNQYNRKRGTYGNGDGKDASHKGGKIAGFEKESTNRGRAEKSRLKKEDITMLEAKFTDDTLASRIKHWSKQHKGTGIGYGHVLGALAIHMKEMGWDKSFKEVVKVAKELSKKKKVESVFAVKGKEDKDGYRHADNPDFKYHMESVNEATPTGRASVVGLSKNKDLVIPKNQMSKAKGQYKKMMNHLMKAGKSMTQPGEIDMMVSHMESAYDEMLALWKNVKEVKKESINEGSKDIARFTATFEKLLKKQMGRKKIPSEKDIERVHSLMRKRYGDLGIEKESVNEATVSGIHKAVKFWQDMFRPGPIPKEYINQLIKKKGVLPSKSHIKAIYRANKNPSSKDLEKAWKGLVKDKYVRAASGLWRWNKQFESVNEKMGPKQFHSYMQYVFDTQFKTPDEKKMKKSLIKKLNIAQKKKGLPIFKESVNEAKLNEYDKWKNTRIQAKNIFRMLKQKHKNNIPKMKKGLEVIFKQNKTKPDQQKVMWQEFNKFFKIKESVNEAKIAHSKGGYIEVGKWYLFNYGKWKTQVKVVSIDSKGMKIYNPNDQWKYIIPMNMIKKKKIGGYMTPLKESVNEGKERISISKDIKTYKGKKVPKGKYEVINARGRFATLMRIHDRVDGGNIYNLVPLNSLRRVAKSIKESVNEGKFAIKHNNGRYLTSKSPQDKKPQYFKSEKDAKNMLSGLDWKYRGNYSIVKESVNEASVSQVRSVIKRVQKQLSNKWKKKGGWENFGQKELRKMKDKFKYDPYGSPQERQIAKVLDDFDNWAVNYVGENVNEASQTAKAILKQLGGNKFIAMTGAKNFTGDNKSLQFSLPKAKGGINKVRIELDRGRDLYNIEFGSLRAGKYKVKKKFKGIYADQMGDLFEKTTGLYIRL